MDLARWWNSKGMLGRLGAIALERGFPIENKRQFLDVNPDVLEQVDPIFS